MKPRRSSFTSMQSLEARTLMAADLTVSAINVTPRYLATNETVPATFVIKNLGSSTAPAGVKLRAHFSKDARWGNSDDWTLPTFTTKTDIAPGKTESIQMDSRATAQGTGSFRIAAFIDGFDRLAESNEANNVTFSAANTVQYYKGFDGDTITGTAKGDRIFIREEQGRVLANVNGVLYGRQRVWMTFGMLVDALAGHDRVVADPSVTVKMYVKGGHGNDIIIGGSGNDTLRGDNGKDQIYGAAGNDILSGGNHDDALFGEAGDDNLSGSNGDDVLDAGAGKNTLSGGAGDDSFFSTGNDASDLIGGGSGNDTAQSDSLDVLSAVEN